MNLFNSLIPTRSRCLSPSEQAAKTSAVPTVKPVYDTRETENAWALTVHLPGVTKDTL